jgi:hypothetical protein
MAITEAERLAQALEPVIKRAQATVDFEAAGFPITDPYDTYPPELYEAAARASVMLPLLTQVAAELRRLSADAQRLDWLESDKGRRVIELGGRWYVRANFGQPHRRAATLRGAIDQAMKDTP